MAERPLQGRRIVVTRPREHAGALAERLERLGADVAVVPLIAIEPLEDDAELAELVERDDHDWIVFTSANAVRAAGPGLRHVRARAAAVGPATAQALRDVGVEPAFSPDVFAALEIAAGLEPLSGARILLPQSEIAEPALPDELRARGATVDAVDAYRTVPRDATERERADLRAADAVILMSGSAARSLAHAGRSRPRARRLHRPEDGRSGRRGRPHGGPHCPRGDLRGHHSGSHVALRGARMTDYVETDPIEGVHAGPGARRPRRWRRTSTLRDLVRETTLDPRDFVYPLFVRPGEGVREPIESMPGIAQLSVDTLAAEAAELDELGIGAVLLFGIPSEKDELGSESHAEDGVVQQAARALKAASPDLVVMTDVCLCEYTSHGHCGLLDADGYVLNDETLAILGRIAVSHADAGADVVAPSGMLDGMVAAIRAALDAERHERVAILSYAVKYASAFYGPFRDAAEGAPAFGDRRSHQMDSANAREALREAALDVDEGADALLVKPAIGYLDVVRRVHERFPDLPLGAYNVSGEYAMVKAAAANGWLDEREAVLELLTGIRRAGADLIVTYHAKEAAAWLRESA